MIGKWKYYYHARKRFAVCDPDTKDENERRMANAQRAKSGRCQPDGRVWAKGG